MLKKVISASLLLMMCFPLASCSDNTVNQYEDKKYWYPSGREISRDKPDVFYVVSTVLLESRDDNGTETKFANLNKDDIKAMEIITTKKSISTQTPFGKMRCFACISLWNVNNF